LILLKDPGITVNNFMDVNEIKKAIDSMQDQFAGQIETLGEDASDDVRKVLEDLFSAIEASMQNAIDKLK
jgi:hypothetical protein